MKDVINKLLSLSEEANRKPTVASGPEIHQSATYAIEYPHLFVLSCVMDKQYSSDKAWKIPTRVCQELVDSKDIKELAKVDEDTYIKFFNNKKLHRFNEAVARDFYAAVHRIMDDYNGDASQIWAGKPSSAEVVYRFLQFKGVGVKIATMATNLLLRDYKVEYSDYCAIDISADVHVMRVMHRLGLIDNEHNREMAIYRARAINPTYPGIIDQFCWELGKNGICRSSAPLCNECPMRDVCKNTIR